MDVTETAVTAESRVRLVRGGAGRGLALPLHFMKPAVPGRGAGSSKRSWDDTEGSFIAGNFASKKRALVIKAPTSRIPNCDFTHKRRLFQCMFAQDDEGGLRPQAEDDTAPVKRQRREAQDIQLPRVGTINLESTHDALIKHTPLDQFWRECIGDVIEWAGKGACEPRKKTPRRLFQHKPAVLEGGGNMGWGVGSRPRNLTDFLSKHSLIRGCLLASSSKYLGLPRTMGLYKTSSYILLRGPDLVSQPRDMPIHTDG
jgi:hypothetical protein